MNREPGIKWLFIDLNSYFASVEQQENPALRGKPIAVVPMETDHTCAIAASYEAKAYGIKTGTIIQDAKKMCPNLRCVLARHDIYVNYHNRILDEFALHAPVNRVWSIDEISSRLPPGKRTVDAATKIAQNIKEGIWKNVGKAINCSIGIAPNSLLAKIAADMKKPDGLVILLQEDLPGPLLKLRLTDLPGIGHNMAKRLRNANINSVQDLWHTSPKQLRKIWNSVEGERFWYLLHGYDLEKPEQKNVMIGHSRILDPNLRSPEKARLMARKLITKASYRLRNKEYYARTISLSVRTTDGHKWYNEKTILPAQDPISLLHTLDYLWDEMLRYFFPHGATQEDLSGQTIRFKKIAVLLLKLSRSNQLNYDLLETGQKERVIKLQKNESLTKALDKLQHKYQKEIVSFGIPPKTLAGYVGTKIAFSRVPDKEEFFS